MAIQKVFQPSSSAMQMQCIDISIVDDSTLEYDTEDFSVLLESSETLNLQIGLLVATVIIVDDDSKELYILHSQFDQNDVISSRCNCEPTAKCLHCGRRRTSGSLCPTEWTD